MGWLARFGLSPTVPLPTWGNTTTVETQILISMEWTQQCTAELNWWVCPVPKCMQSFLSIEAISDGIFPRASTPLPDHFKDTSSWTLCATFSLGDWPEAEVSAINAWGVFFSEEAYPSLLWPFAYLEIQVFETYSAFTAGIKKTFLQGRKETILWVQTCVTREQLEDEQVKVQLVVDGELIGESVGDVLDSFWEPKNFSLVVGKTGYETYRLKSSAVNLFSPPLSVQRMMDMTNKSRGEDECGQPGDLVSWAEADWKVEDTATMIHLDKDVYDSCRKKSSVSVFQFYEPHRLEDCMQHCQKIGKGKSPSVGSFEEWERVRGEVELFTKLVNLGRIWLAVTEGDVQGRLNRLAHWPDTETLDEGQIVPLEATEGVWRDYYTGVRVNVLYDGHRMNKKDTEYGEAVSYTHLTLPTNREV